MAFCQWRSGLGLVLFAIACKKMTQEAALLFFLFKKCELESERQITEIRIREEERRVINYVEKPPIVSASNNNYWLDQAFNLL